MAVAYTVIVVRDTRRTAIQVLLLDDLVRIVYIELKIGHDRQMIPEDMLKVVYVTQVREHVSHNVDNRVGATLTLFPVLDSPCHIASELSLIHI